MNEIGINEEYERITHLLDKKRVAEALSRMETFTQNTSNWELQNKVEEIQTSYNYMLQYMKQGVADPERNKLYQQLIAKAYILTEQIKITKLTPLSIKYFYDRKRFYKLIPLRSLAAIQMELESFTEEIAIAKLLNQGENQNRQLNSIRVRHEAALSELFYVAWLADEWSEQTEKEARALLNSVLSQPNDLSLFISALTLSLMNSLDIRKLMLLFDAYRHTSTEVNQRALVGLALIIFQYDKQLIYYPLVNARIKLLNEDNLFSEDLNRVQIQLLRCRETEKIDRKMREEILPELLKNPNLRNVQFDVDMPDEEGGQNDKNPDWEDWMDQSGLSDKLKEMSELQMEGADVYMSTFAQLKTYPFFREMANWFYPFDIQHSEVVNTFSDNLNKRDSLLKTIFQSGFFCNSDKYSFCFTMLQVPESQRKMMEQQFESQNEALEEDKKFDKFVEYAQRPASISNQYIHDLYRFFKLYPRRHEFNDPFQESLNLQYCATLKETLSNSTHQLNLASYFFHKNYLLEAWLLYEEIIKTRGEDAEIYQKMGYCMQKSRGYEKAIESYLQADLLKPDNVWTNRHLAMCYKQLDKLDKALEYYQKVEATQSENLNILKQIGYCLIGLKRYEEALSYFFKIEYLEPESSKTWRALAWCSFVTGKHEQAMRYYDRLLDKETQAQDYMNAGHTAWSLGNIEKAVKMYANSLAMSEDTDAFMSLFNKDKADLLSQGIHKEDIPLMMDLLRMGK